MSKLLGKEEKQIIVIRSAYNETGSVDSDCTQNGGNCCASGYCCNGSKRDKE